MNNFHNTTVQTKIDCDAWAGPMIRWRNENDHRRQHHHCSAAKKIGYYEQASLCQRRHAARWLQHLRAGFTFLYEQEGAKDEAAKSWVTVGVGVNQSWVFTANCASSLWPTQWFRPSKPFSPFRLCPLLGKTVQRCRLVWPLLPMRFAAVSLAWMPTSLGLLPCFHRGDGTTGYGNVCYLACGHLIRIAWPGHDLT